MKTRKQKTKRKIVPCAAMMSGQIDITDVSEEEKGYWTSIYPEYHRRAQKTRMEADRYYSRQYEH